ncbi:MAG: hypothetical protein JJT77_04055 [Crocinitomicaceae bacterium]|nr:hypothetical protein [Crocinitomicaceae bacterium]
MELDQHDKAQEPKVRPTFLTVLLVMSSISIGLSILSTLSGLVSGPMDPASVEQFTAEQYEAVGELKNLGMEDVSEMIASMMELTIYQSQNNYYLFQLVNLLTLFVGAYGIFLMFKLKKLGFHLYVAYSILPIIWFYVFVPAELIPNFLVFGSLFLSVLFIILYAVHLKKMEG